MCVNYPEAGYNLGGEDERGDVRNLINNLNILIILLDKDFFPCYKLKSFNTKEVGDLHIMPFLKNTLLKQKKEDGMKKLVIVAIAVLLALPVLSYAGSATSRWDMTIGGFVQMHMGWVDSQMGSAFNKNAAFRSNGTREVQGNEVGNLFAEGQSRLNFIMRGPDALGAKTWARLEFDFTTVPAGESFGLANFRHSYMQFDWADDSLLIGNTWWTAMAISPGGGLTFQSLPNIMIPSRVIQTRYTHRFGKSGLQLNFALEYPGLNKWMNPNNDYNDRYTTSLYPNGVVNIDYVSDACGAVGMEKLHFGSSFVYGRERAVTSYASALRGTTYGEKENDGWFANAYFFVPIIPGKTGNKAGATGIQGAFLMGQGLNNYSGNGFVQTYSRVGGTTLNQNFKEDFSTPLGYGYYGALTVYALDNVHFDLIYTDTISKASGYWRSYLATQNSVYRTVLYNAAVTWEPNPAIQLGAEYTRIFTKYAQIGYGGVGIMGANKIDGTMNALRLFMQYSF